MPSPAATAGLRTDFRGSSAHPLPTARGARAQAAPADADGLLRGVAFGLAFVAPFWAAVAVVVLRVV